MQPDVRDLIRYSASVSGWVGVSMSAAPARQYPFELPGSIAIEPCEKGLFQCLQHW